MINFDGTLLDNQFIAIDNRGFAYGDSLFETIKCIDGNILFWEDHYFRLMASMRVMRMEIPMNFTMEFLQFEILKTIDANSLGDRTARIKLMISRIAGGLYLPKSNDVEFFIMTKPLQSEIYAFDDSPYEVDLFKDHYVSPSLLSTLKTNNRALNIVGSIYAKENFLDNCFILNTNKNVVEALNGNVFLVNGNTIKTPPISDGCVKGIMRKQILELLSKDNGYEVIEESISTFELQKADELFITNVIVGVRPVTKYRKKTFDNTVARKMIHKLNLETRSL